MNVRKALRDGVSRERGEAGIAKTARRGQAGDVIEPWTCVSSERLAGCSIFELRRVVRRSPRTGRAHDFYVLDAPDWVNVIALTPDRQMILVEQYRHGTESVDLEIPGGVMDPTDASPLETGVRELREETGYEGQRARVIAQVRPNPAIMSNTCFTVLVEDCTRQHALAFDHAEDLNTRLVPLAEMPGLVADGTIRHSLVVAALYQHELLSRRKV